MFLGYCLQTAIRHVEVVGCFVLIFLLLPARSEVTKVGAGLFKKV